MKNTILNNLKVAAEKRAAEEAAKKAADKAAKAEAADKAAVEAFAAAHKDVDLATIKDIIDAANDGKLFFITMGYDHLVADYATSKKDAEQHITWIYRSARLNREEGLVDSSSIMHGMMEMQKKFQIANDAMEAGLIPEDCIIDENNVEHWVIGNKAYTTEGIEEANLDDIETKLSMKDRKTLLRERIKKYQEELERLESLSEDENNDFDNDDYWEDESKDWDEYYDEDYDERK